MKIKRVIIIGSLLLLLFLLGSKIFSVVQDYLFQQEELHFLQTKGGVEVVLQVDVKNLDPQQKTTVFEADKEIIYKRLRLLGFYPFIHTSPNYKITIDLANVSNLNDLVKLIETHAEISFLEEGGIKTELTGADVQKATVIYPGQGKAELQISFTEAGKKLLTEITKRNVGKTLTIMLDKQILEVPKISQPILTGEAVISGSFSEDRAKELAILLNAGALPAPFVVISTRKLMPREVHEAK